MQVFGFEAVPLIIAPTVGLAVGILGTWDEKRAQAAGKPVGLASEYHLWGGLAAAGVGIYGDFAGWNPLVTESLIVSGLAQMTAELGVHLQGGPFTAPAGAPGCPK